MANTDSKQMIVGLDIGPSKVVAVVGEIDSDGGLEVVGIGSHPSRGMKKGVVVNIESTVNAIQRAVEEAELMAGCQIHSVYVGIAGSHIRSVNSHGIVAIRDQEVFQQDVDRAMDVTQFRRLPARHPNQFHPRQQPLWRSQYLTQQSSVYCRCWPSSLSPIRGSLHCQTLITKCHSCSVLVTQVDLCDRARW